MVKEQRTGLFTNGKIDEAYAEAWADHRGQCTEATLYRDTEERIDGWHEVHLSCPNCTFRMKVSRPTWKTTKPQGAAMSWWHHD